MMPSLALKASCLDEEKARRIFLLVLAESIETLLEGEFLVLPQGKNLPLTDTSDIAVMFGETDE